MFTIGGKYKRKSVKRGGCNSMLPLSPAPFNSLDNTLPGGANFERVSPAMFPSNQVGGDGYGYNGGQDVATFGGSYIPASRYTAEAGGYSDRGGNNFGMSGGRRRTRRSRSTKRRGSTKRGGKAKRSRSTKRRSSKKSKWYQVGCKRK